MVKSIWRTVGNAISVFVRLLEAAFSEKTKKVNLIRIKSIFVKARINYYLFLTALIVLDAVLLRSPNLLGKIGLIIYKYHYLRTFPKALLTVSLVVGVASILAEVIRFTVRNDMIKRITGRVILFLFLLASAVILIKTAMDFTAWSYVHTGLRFRLGAYLLPAILVLVFTRAWLTLPKKKEKFPVSPVVEDKKPESFIK